MDQILNYVKPELLIVGVVLYLLGIGLKKAQVINDKYIPLILGGAGILICAIYVFAACTCSTGREVAMAVFTSITQGVLVAGLSTYVHQIIKQAGKEG